jgi:hypothetical protein
MTAACEFASFWHGGPLNPLAYACLASFPRAEAPIRLYSYDLGVEVPPGVRLADARSVSPDESLARRFTVAGKPSMATFADFFRYRMIRETGCCWVDTDLICLKEPEFADEPVIFCRQADAVSTLLVNNAVLRLPPSEPALAELIATAESAIGVDQKWGALGPFLLTPVLEKHGLYAKALDPHVCYPVEPEQFWKLFLPEWRDWVEETVAGATMVHLWSEAIRWTGYDFAVRPPPGSYLHDFVRTAGVLDRFRRSCGEDEVRRLMGREIAASRARGSGDPSLRRRQIAKPSAADGFRRSTARPRPRE